MELRDYLNLPGNTQERLAADLSSTGAAIGQSAISQWLSKRVPAERVLQVEQATKGQVTRQELRPDLYPPETPKRRRRAA